MRDRSGFHVQPEVKLSQSLAFDLGGVLRRADAIDQGDLRQFAKAAVRQALLDAVDSLAEPEEEAEDDESAEEGMRPEDLNATNDD